MFEDFLSSKDGWLNGKGPLSGIVFSTRLRLARNIAGYGFPSHINAGQREEIMEKIKKSYKSVPRLKKDAFLLMEDLSEVDRQFLVERHLVSCEHTVSLKGKGLIISADEQVSIMINEEDHMRMQVVAGGFDLEKCWQAINEIDDGFAQLFRFSFSPEWGYLTSCPTNVGTALRASCMMHMPALILTKRINKILEFLAKISFTTRGFCGEGTEALGDFFQISNQVSLGVSEREIIDNLTAVVNQVKEQELDAREELLGKYKANMEDNAWRALGILRNARLMSSKEALSHLSMLSLGIELGIIKNIKRETINSLFIVIQPAHLQKMEKKPLKEDERDYIRAQIIREKLDNADGI